jgi:hypothetical protein
MRTFMTEQSNNRCVVLLPAADPRFTRLFDELFTIAITEAGLIPHRIEQIAAEHFPVERLVHEIAKADIVFADLSESSDEIWFALGCALALTKPLCLISSTLEFTLPLNLQNLEIIPYPTAPFPRDYSQLRLGITHQLLAKRPRPIARQLQQPAPQESFQRQQPEPQESFQRQRAETQESFQRQQPKPQESFQRQQPLQPQQPLPVAAAPLPIAAHIAAPVPAAPLPMPMAAPIASPVPAAPAPIAAPVAEAVANTPLSDELTSHEVLALSIIDIHASSEGLSPRDLGLEMQANDSAHLTSHAMSSLKRRKFIDRRPVSVTDGADSYLSEKLFITWSGKNWLLQHGKRSHSLRSNSAPNQVFMAAR